MDPKLQPAHPASLLVALPLCWFRKGNGPAGTFSLHLWAPRPWRRLPESSLPRSWQRPPCCLLLSSSGAELQVQTPEEVTAVLQRHNEGSPASGEHLPRQIPAPPVHRRGVSRDTVVSAPPRTDTSLLEGELFTQEWFVLADYRIV